MQKISLKNREIDALYQGLMTLGKASGVEFVVARSRNLKAAAPFVESFKDARAPFDEAVAATYKEHGDEVREGVWEIKAGDGRVALAKVNLKFSGLIQELNEIMGKEVEIELYMVPVASLPDMTGDQLEAIAPMIDGL